MDQTTDLKDVNLNELSIEELQALKENGDFEKTIREMEQLKQQQKQAPVILMKKKVTNYFMRPMAQLDELIEFLRLFRTWKKEKQVRAKDYMSEDDYQFNVVYAIIPVQKNTKTDDVREVLEETLGDKIKPYGVEPIIFSDNEMAVANNPSFITKLLGEVRKDSLTILLGDIFMKIRRHILLNNKEIIRSQHQTISDEFNDAINEEKHKGQYYGAKLPPKLP